MILENWLTSGLHLVQGAKHILDQEWDSVESTRLCQTRAFVIFGQHQPQNSAMTPLLVSFTSNVSDIRIDLDDCIEDRIDLGDSGKVGLVPDQHGYREHCVGSTSTRSRLVKWEPWSPICKSLMLA